MIRPMKTFTIDMYKMITSKDGSLFTDALAYSIIAGLAPILILIVILASKYAIGVDQLIGVLQHYIPSDLIVPFVDYLRSTGVQDNILLLIPLGVASMWAASQSIYSFLLISTEREGISIPAMLLRAVSIIYFIVIVSLMLVVTTLFGLFAPLRKSFIAYPVLLTIFFFFFYRTLSFRYKKVKQVIVGSVFSGVGLSLLGTLFFVVMDRYSHYDTIYGPLASLMMALISAWIISWIIYLGYCINVCLRDEADRRKKDPWFVRTFDRNGKEGILNAR